MTTTKSLYIALELGQDKWLLACAGEAVEKPRLRSMPARDLERLATDFARDIQAAAGRARSGLDEAGLRDLRGILSDALGRISTEVFGPVSQKAPAEQAPTEQAAAERAATR